MGWNNGMYTSETSMGEFELLMEKADFELLKEEERAKPPVDLNPFGRSGKGSFSPSTAIEQGITPVERFKEWDTALKTAEQIKANRAWIGTDSGEEPGLEGSLLDPMGYASAGTTARVASILIPKAASRMEKATVINESINSIKPHQAVQDAFRGYGREVRNTILPPHMAKPLKTSPSYREVSDIGEDAGGMYIGKASDAREVPGNIYVDTGWGKDATALSKRHEYNHSTWDKDGLPLSDTQLRMSNRFNTKGVTLDPEYISRPTEFSAHAREVQDLLLKVKNNPGDSKLLDEVESLVGNLAPYMDDFAKKYPGKGADKVAEGMDMLRKHGRDKNFEHKIAAPKFRPKYR